MAKEKSGGDVVVEEIRQGIKNPSTSGGGMPSKQTFIPKEGTKRFRWLTDYGDCIKVKMHAKWKIIFPQPCLTYYGKKCPFCKGDFRTFTSYVWTVWEYGDLKEGGEGRRRILLSEARPKQIAEDLLEHYDENGTIKDRDYTVQRLGERQDTRYKVRPVKGGPSKFRPEPSDTKTAPFSKDKVFAILSERLVESAKARESDEDAGDDKDDDD